MTSFAVTVEPAAQPRAAAAACLAHALAAASPWLAHWETIPAAALSLATMAALVATLGCVPGPHCRLAAVAIDGRGCRARLAGAQGPVAAALGSGSRAAAAFVFLEVRAEGRRLGWLLPRGALPAPEFRRLKARIRLSC